MRKNILTKNFVLTTSAIFVGLFVARFAHAQNNFLDLICNSVIPVIDAIMVALGGIALLVFIWGLVKFIAKAGNEDARKEGRQVMIWGIIAFFVMVSLWGIVELIQGSLGGIYGNPFPVTGGCNSV